MRSSMPKIQYLSRLRKFFSSSYFLKWDRLRQHFMWPQSVADSAPIESRAFGSLEERRAFPAKSGVCPVLWTRHTIAGPAFGPENFAFCTLAAQVWYAALKHLPLSSRYWKPESRRGQASVPDSCVNDSPEESGASLRRTILFSPRFSSCPDLSPAISSVVSPVP